MECQDALLLRGEGTGRLLQEPRVQTLVVTRGPFNQQFAVDLPYEALLRLDLDGAVFENFRALLAAIRFSQLAGLKAYAAIASV